MTRELTAPDIEPSVRTAATRQWRAAWKQIGTRLGVGRVDQPRRARRAAWKESRRQYRLAEQAERSLG